MDNEQCFLRRNICFYNRKSKLDKHSCQEKMHSGIFKTIRIQSDPRSVARIDIINYKNRKKEKHLYSRWLSLIYQSYDVHSVT